MSIMAAKLGVPGHAIVFDPTLARGLNYYTGCIIEVKSLDVEMGSIAGGGRYDDLTGVFGGKGLSGVGVSFGIDRIYDVMEEKGLFPDLSQSRAKLIFIWFDEPTLDFCLKMATRLRRQGIATEVHAEGGKLKKQLAYADKLGIAHAAIVGPDELAQGHIALRQMKAGVQQLVTPAELELLFNE